MYYRIKCLLIFITLCNGWKAIYAQNLDPLVLTHKVAEKVIADTRFEWKWVLQKEELGMQVIDFGFLNLPANSTALALKNAQVNSDTVVRFGCCGVGHMKVWVNGKLCWEQKGVRLVKPKEIAYNRFSFEWYFDIPLKKGKNEILIEYKNISTYPIMFLRPVTKVGDLDQSVLPAEGHFTQWVYAGPIDTASVSFPIKNYYHQQGGIVSWQTAPQKVLPELVVPSGAAYQRDPYSDWHYSHGTLMWSILGLYEKTKSEDYLRFVKKYTSFVLDNLNYLKWQYDSLHAWRGSYHRIFRRSMLDDAGAPVLPFVDLYLAEKDGRMAQFIQLFANYISTKQVRLKDGTFCRPEPEEYTIWADDLFMSVPFLIRMKKATGEEWYLKDAVHQVINFRKYLLDSTTGLYKHGWFSQTNCQSDVYWGRANGWVAWATAELLDVLDKTHPEYKKIRQAFREHMSALSKYQATDGFWHQVLIRPDSYKETSCTAMFALAIARGIRRGWLDPSFKPIALKAWSAVASQIDAQGVVHGICRGTEIGANDQFYMDRATINNDPRGLGAVITAGIEIDQLSKMIKD